ncbi:hypothetical protein [Salinivibrio sp. YCSC6]|uniref:hypothetical protein n=1 Tax=Salinivibrio sp. YCSC6 TaxID=2003370 RepID=UPI000BBB71CA|nr:hypothetical protein [Salinivibrio sp. YCSC6]PCE68812.1 hypothetical protein B6G00_11250 [Salinivibrio sp. YCSC6]QCF36756.1 hypothetical protein E8E00_11630 [Salinivibrio sp. YCSC6]
MSNNVEKLTLLEVILGSKVVVPKLNIQGNQNSNILNIVSSDLFSGLKHYFDTSAPFFQTSLPLERIVRYKNGSFSSMEKSVKGGFSQHQGFEILNGMDVVQQLMTCVMPMLNQRLTSIYSDLINQNNHYLSQIQDQFIIPEISKLKSIAEFIQDVSEEIQHISKSNNLSIATLTNIQQRRIDLKQVFHTFITRLEDGVNTQFFDPQSIANNYLIARYALSNYIVSLVLECIVSGNIDDESVQRLEEKVEKCFNDLNDITWKLSDILENRKFTNANEINNINSFYRWSYDYMAQNQLHNLHNQNYCIDNIKNRTLSYFDIEVEKQRLKDFVNARHDFIKTIRITES